VPIYVYRCDCGLRFERLLPRDADAPDCPECGGATRRIPAGSSLGGRTSQRPAKEGVPPQWQGVRDGGPSRVQREVEFRQRLEVKRAGNPPPTAPGAASERRPGGGSGAQPPSAAD
jgi:putative FmdB family regulatory protein